MTASTTKPEILDESERKKGLLMIVASSLLRGFQGFFVRITQWTPNHTIPLTFFRLAIPAILVYFYSWIIGKRIRGIFSRDKWPVHGTSLFVAIRMSFFFLGYQYADMSSATVVFFSSGVFVTLLEPYFFGEKLSRRTLFAALLGFVGVIVIFLNQTISLQNTKFLGLVFMALAGLLVIFEVILKKKFVKRVSSVEWVFYQGLLSSVVLFPLVFLFPFPTLAVWPWIILFAVVIGTFGFALDMGAFRRVRISDASVTRYIEPVATMLVGFLLFHEAVTWNKILGAVIVFTSVLIVIKKKS